MTNIISNLNPFHPDCKTVFFFILQNFQVYFTILMTYAWHKEQPKQHFKAKA